MEAFIVPVSSIFIVIDEREIKLAAKISGDNLYLEMVNPYLGDLRKQGGHYLTTKENKKAWAGFANC